jgi:hypothetical protein
MIFTGSHVLAKFKKRPHRASIFTHRLIPLKFKEYIEIFPCLFMGNKQRRAASGPNIL